MPELRWTLLLVGVVFVVALTWWERRRQTQSRSPAPGMEPPAVEHDGSSASSEMFREPVLNLPELRVRDSAVPHELPVVEIEADSLKTRRAEVQPAAVARVPVTPVVSAPAPAPAPEADDDFEGVIGPVRIRPAAAAPMETAAVPASATVAEEPPAAAPAMVFADAPPEVEPIVEWPTDEQRRILALRLVSGPQDRLAGRALRQALRAEGFVLGKYSIFHKPDESGRALLSAASLSKPGTFDMAAMDLQRYGGLSLFAVLPGPKPPLETFDELVLTARSLSERLRGTLQDERGGALTAARIVELREGLSEETPP